MVVEVSKVTNFNPYDNTETSLCSSGFSELNHLLHNGLSYLWCSSVCLVMVKYYVYLWPKTKKKHQWIERSVTDIKTLDRIYVTGVTNVENLSGKMKWNFKILTVMWKWHGLGKQLWFSLQKMFSTLQHQSFSVDQDPWCHTTPWYFHNKISMSQWHYTITMT